MKLYFLFFVVLVLLQPGLQCADLVFDEMQRIAAQCEGAELSRFPSLRDRIVEVRKSLGRLGVVRTIIMVLGF